MLVKLVKNHDIQCTLIFLSCCLIKGNIGKDNLEKFEKLEIGLTHIEYVFVCIIFNLYVFDFKLVFSNFKF